MKKFLKNKKGFTLIELLAVIVVLAIILVIATGSVLNVIENTRVSAFNSTYSIVIKTIKDNVTMENMGLQSNNITCSSDPSNSDNCYDKYDISKDDYIMEVTGDSSNGYTLVLGGKGEFENIELKNDTVVNGSTVKGNCALNGACAEVENKPTIATKIDATTVTVSGIGEDISEKTGIIDKLEAIKKYPSFAKNQEDDNLKIIGEEKEFFAISFPKEKMSEVLEKYGFGETKCSDTKCYLVYVNENFITPNRSYKIITSETFGEASVCYSSDPSHYIASIDQDEVCKIERVEPGSSNKETFVYYRKKSGGFSVQAVLK